MIERAQIARGGILIVGDDLAGAEVARELGGATVVEPRACAAADFDRRTVMVESARGFDAIAYAELVIAAPLEDDRLALRLGLPRDGRGRVPVDELLRVSGVPHVSVVGGDGDVSDLVHRLRGTPGANGRGESP
jgi:hypothetical protein